MMEIRTYENAGIDTKKMAKIVLSHEELHGMLGLPDDVLITSMHTTRGEPETGVYMICERFNAVPEGDVAPAISIEDVNSIGLWDEENN